jgi:hypothetical protein
MTKRVITAIRNFFDPNRLGPHNFMVIVLSAVAIGCWRKTRKAVLGESSRA